jgi:hypothetical protein
MSRPVAIVLRTFSAGCCVDMPQALKPLAEPYSPFGTGPTGSKGTLSRRNLCDRYLLLVQAQCDQEIDRVLQRFIL